MEIFTNGAIYTWKIQFRGLYDDNESPYVISPRIILVLKPFPLEGFSFT